MSNTINNEGLICYRFKSEKETDVIKFQGDVISVGQLKKMIEDKRMSYLTRKKRQRMFQEKVQMKVVQKELTNEMDFLTSNQQVIIERVPMEFVDITYYANPNNKNDQRANQRNKKLKPSATTVEQQNAKNWMAQINAPQRIEVQQYNQMEQAQKQDTDQGIKRYFTEDELLEALQKARYFVIRSSNWENIMISRKYEEWATTKSNELRLIDAFNTSPHVFLFYSVSKMTDFKGFARMGSLPSKSQGGHWRNTDNIKLGGCFTVQWITTASLSFQKIRNMTNPYNNNEPIKNSRDCTEIDPKVGKEICKLFEVPFRDVSVPPESFIIKAQQFGVSDTQVAIQQLSYLDQNQVQQQREKNISLTDRPLMQNLVHLNPKLPQGLIQMTQSQYNDLLQDLSGVVKKFLNKDQKIKSGKEKDDESQRSRRSKRSRDRKKKIKRKKDRKRKRSRD